MLDSVYGSLGASSENWPIRIYSFTMEEGRTKLSLSFSNDCCDELVYNFKDFLLGAGFIESTVMESMEKLIGDYESLHPRKDSAEPSFPD